MPTIRYAVDERPDDAAFHALWVSAWGEAPPASWTPILDRSLCFVCAYRDEQLVGFVNVGWDGGIHASIFDLCVHPDAQRRGVATAMLQRAAHEAAGRGAGWLHVDHEPHLAPLYTRAGFRPTSAGLMRLGEATATGDVALDDEALRLLPLPLLAPGVLADDEIELRLTRARAADPANGRVPDYTFAIARRTEGVPVGRVSLRVSDEPRFHLYFGQIGYSVDPGHRGRGYAARAVRLLVPLARRHGFPELWVTCAPDNHASRYTRDLAGPP